ncbi:uncharacterized protein ZMO1_ZMO0231 [Zymomonas mobilis subsp. mobilis ZM4 = ATCC 31821]|uniref:Uncharacterized protein n=2 Tax=Zymomonas mobilis subsp. mobilis TaxID=120045 RepID=Q5NQZ9_ZYMMO|nr:hypothetical protein [Zymomonas mobilis]AAV88855.2 conserved hypothetical protein [Zymomonas mobilis subsp. mobilis ZM4 = ATCC 31821]ACV75529.1 hypothetical protein Za10_0983 [Zymomonas mobilis subsp. mobilis NCIMB 11163]AEH62633.1 conserved hypothetical protein [Zymomonas mobilis subsp. mobilis ATCC 10988]AHB10315.1 hypothetical protein ZCP4_1017 [Zymomonas mobilis subsp. mobilis str. CP4 = NRRL B-14023]AHJ70622.1 hypothetical protein A254_01009 [Zymomonas mobilis subsp. mobilis NRRL B-125
MNSPKKPANGAMALVEMKEFATFPAATQRYIRRSLDIGLKRHDVLERWSRDVIEAASIRAQTQVYHHLDTVRHHLPDDNGLESLQHFMTPLIIMSAFDLGQDRLNSFSAYRFLYERLIGAAVRPWLPSAFCASAALPHLHPEKRRALLQSISEAAVTAPGWSNRPPCFIPEWVEKVQQHLPN